jgi:hypothetical protein
MLQYYKIVYFLDVLDIVSSPSLLPPFSPSSTLFLCPHMALLPQGCNLHGRPCTFELYFTNHYDGLLRGA